MNSRGLRKHVLSHLTETTALREQVSAALKSAPKPSRLVFECIGRFFLQGSKAYAKDSPMIPARQASVQVLEYYLLSGCVGGEEDVEASLKREAESAAVAWRKRLIVEGGVARATKVDARGLVLFVAGFGIPDVFRDDDVFNLVRLSNVKEISDALCKSKPFLKRVSDIADGMMKKGMVVNAVDLGYTFGFEEKFSPQTALNSFLRKSEETWKKAKQDARNFPSMLKEVHEKYLTVLKSVVNCLESHKIDFVKLIPGWQLKDKISDLEKDISDANKKIEEKSAHKRKMDKSNLSNKMKIPETKRSRFVGNGKDASMLSPSLTALQEQRLLSHMDGNSSYDGSLSAHLLDGRSYGYPNNYLTASAQVGSVSDSLAEKYLGSALTNGTNMLGGAIGGSYSGYQGGVIRDNVGTVLNSNSHLYRWHGIGEGALSHDRPVGQSYVGQSPSALVNNLYGKTPTDNFSGVPEHLSIGASSRTGGPDLYSFADSVFDS
uniref:FRIGIDA-like protein n=2 Tax=Cajanus cajan TaxID=3821 RepID=A0A151TR52_CAJCA|nr:Protein FRIGIDA [Cajanus cajan]